MKQLVTHTSEHMNGAGAVHQTAGSGERTHNPDAAPRMVLLLPTIIIVLCLSIFP
jgi:hypothetical protein